MRVQSTQATSSATPASARAAGLGSDPPAPAGTGAAGPARATTGDRLCHPVGTGRATMKPGCVTREAMQCPPGSVTTKARLCPLAVPPWLCHWRGQAVSPVGPGCVTIKARQCPPGSATLAVPQGTELGTARLEGKGMWKGKGTQCWHSFYSRATL